MRIPAVCLAVLFLAGCASSPSSAPAAYPWPECEPVVRWLERNCADPSGLEVIEWERRTPLPEHRRVDVVVRYRAKNRYGALSVWRQGFKVGADGKVEGDTPVERR